ncbi:MAG TPA: hypothetical protein VMF53_17220 [Alphaproteobacteria bacterium]|nr:hypothetical protein [Alphaproteobacteria bacterium]
MQPHKFKVGQTVRFFQSTIVIATRKEGPDATPERYEITRLLPSDGAQQQYRIKGCTKGQERVVVESEIG